MGYEHRSTKEICRHHNCKGWAQRNYQARDLKKDSKLMNLPNHNTALENILIRYAISLKKSVVRPKALAAINKLMYEEMLAVIGPDVKPNMHPGLLQSNQEAQNRLKKRQRQAAAERFNDGK